MTKRIFALLLSLAMVFTVVSCGDKDTGKTSTGTSTGTSAGTSTEDEGIKPLTEITLPIVDEKVEYDSWMVWSNDYRTIEEIDAHNKLAELTNVYINYSTILGTAATEKFGLLLASGDYPHIVEAGSGSDYVKYPGGDDAGISDGIWTDLTDLIPIYCPNYMKYINASDDVRRQATTDEGRYAAMYMFRCSYDNIENQTVVIEPEPAWMGMCIRQDWLDALNLEIPTTIDELHDVLVAFKDAGYGGLGLLANGTMSNIPYLQGAFGVTNEYFVADDGTVGFGPVTDEYREYLRTMNAWWDEDLIYGDFASNILSTTSNDAWANGDIGVYTHAWVCLWDWMYTMGMTDNPEFSLAPMVAITQANGATSGITYQSDTAVSPMYLTSSCTDEDLPILLQWADYCYTWEGMLLNSCGVEGVSYEVDPESEFYYPFTDAVMNCVIEGVSIAPITSRRLYNLDNFHGLYNWEIMWNMYEQAGQGKFLEGYYTWYNETDDRMIPLRVSFTAEEGNEYNGLYADVQAYVEEATVKFITGALDVETDWDKYISDLTAMNYERCLEMKGIAYDRYMSK